MRSPHDVPTLTVDELIVETRRLAELNRALELRLRSRRLLSLLGVALGAALVFYAWSIHGLLSENALLLRTNTEMVQSGNALLRANGAKEPRSGSSREQKGPAVEAAPTEPAPRPRPEGCSQGQPGCDSPTRWVPGFPGPRISVKRTSHKSS